MAPRGFENVRPLLVSTNDGHICQLEEYLYYRDSRGNYYRTKTDTDGLSTPRLIWFLIPPFGKIWKSGVIHDAAFRLKLERWNGHKWVACILNEKQCNWLIHDAMESQGASWIEHTVIYLALKWFGWRAFDEDRKNICRIH